MIYYSEFNMTENINFVLSILIFINKYMIKREKIF